MGTSSGLFTLRTPEDLLDKLRRDLARVESNPLDADAAFDFFVTAHHFPEWLRKARRNAAALFSSVRNRLILKVVAEVANGGKHFLAKPGTADAVRQTASRAGGFDPSSFQGSDFDVGSLVIELDPAAAKHLGAAIDVVNLAREVVVLYDAAIAGAAHHQHHMYRKPTT
jgi:hypothetical protein